MSSSPQREARMSQPLPCPECGAVKMTHVVGSCRLDDGLTVKSLRHFRCRACGAKFFDDEAMHRIQAERTKHSLAHAV